jgi:peptide chain release factor subunit 1
VTPEEAPVQINDLDHDRLRRLAALRPQNGRSVLSLYLDLDPSAYGTQPARASQITSLLDEADRHAREKSLDHDVRVALRQDIGRVRDFLRGDFSAKGAHALALFASRPADLFEVLRLPDAVRGAVVVDDTPWLDPLIGREPPRRCLALVNRRAFRAFADSPARELHEVAALTADVPRRHDQGGWSQANYGRHLEADVRRHVERSLRLLFEHHQREPFDLLAIGCTAELWPEVEQQLHPYLRECLLGRFEVETENVTEDGLLAAAAPLFETAERRHVDELLGRVQAGVASGRRAADGLVPVLNALNERRVEALLYEPSFRHDGYVCPQSGWIGLDAALCPSGEENAEARDNVLEDAIAVAILQSAAVHALRDRPELGPLGGIAAVLRF